MQAQSLRVLYAIMSYEPENIGNEAHEEIVANLRERGHSVEVFTLRASGAKHRDRNEERGKGEGKRTEDGNQDTPSENSKLTHRATLRAEIQNSKFKTNTLVFPKSNLFRRFLRGLCQAVFHYNYFLEVVFGLRRLWQEHEYDVVHTEAAYPLGTAVALSQVFRKKKIPQVINLQGADVMNLPRYDYGYGRYRLVRWLLRYTFKRAAGVRANSYYTAELAQKLGANPKYTRTILRNIGSAVCPPADLDLIANKQSKAAELRERYGLNSGPILMSYSRLHPFKGVEFLVRAIPLIKEKYGPVNLLICGPSRSTPRFGDYRRYLEKLAQELGVQEEIIFTGRIDFAQSRDYLAATDVLVVPSVVEALNRVAIEAAAIGTPSIITESTGVGPHAAEAGVALLVKPASETALADAILKLLQNPTLRAEMGAHGPSWAQRYTGPLVTAQLLDLYSVSLNSKFKIQNSKLCYLAYPSSLILKSANGIQTFSTVRELKKIAPDALVLLPKLPGRSSAFHEVGARHLPRLPLNFFSNFPILKKVPWGYLERIFFATEAGFYLLGRRLTGRPCKAIYVRDVICAYWLLRFWQPLLGAKIIYEAHDLEARNPSRARGKRLSALLQHMDATLLGKADGVVSLTTAFKDFLNEDGWRASAQPTTVIPDAYDANRYKPLPQTEARQALNLPENEFAIVYAGLTFAYRGLDKFIEAFGVFLKESSADARLYLVGGRSFEVEQMREVAKQAGLAERVRLVGQTGQHEVNLWLNAASLTVIPDTVTDITASPLKMFEYAAVARPVLLPDLPALREILGDPGAVYFERGNMRALTDALCWVYTHPAEAAAHGEAAHTRVAAYTYENRAKTILEFVDIILN